MILAIDMVIHGKIMGNIQNKVTFTDKTKFDEQQAVLDYFIHSADLAHNTKPFEISLQWVELLSNEFLLQGNKEKEMNLPISYFM
jgi:calcium/calmodulin-dependent 3',5'-cyclic nucleotide phosphodiesterase